MRKIVFVLVTLTLLVGAHVATAAPAKIYKNCEALRAVYPKGVAQTKVASKKTGAKYAPSIYKQNKSKDRDKDGSACES